MGVELSVRCGRHHRIPPAQGGPRVAGADLLGSPSCALAGELGATSFPVTGRRSMMTRECFEERAAKLRRRTGLPPAEQEVTVAALGSAVFVV